MERLQKFAASLQVNRYDTRDLLFCALGGVFLGQLRPWWHYPLLVLAYLVASLVIGIFASYRPKLGWPR